METTRNARQVRQPRQRKPPRLTITASPRDEATFLRQAVRLRKPPPKPRVAAPPGQACGAASAAPAAGPLASNSQDDIDAMLAGPR